MIRNYLSIIVYHHAPESFPQQLACIRRYAEVVGIEDGLRRLGEPGHSGRVAAITFDDAYEDVYLYAFPCLRREGVPATLFVPTSHIGNEKIFWWDEVNLLLSETRCAPIERDGQIHNLGPPWQRGALAGKIRQDLRLRTPREIKEAMGALREKLPIEGLTLPARFRIMDWTQVKEMAAAGIEIGSHTASHAALSTLSREEQVQELQSSKDVLERKLGRPVRGLAYPFGGQEFFNNSIKSIAFSCSYHYAVSNITGINHGNTDVYSLYRCAVDGNTKDWQLALIAKGLWPYLQPLRKIWGKIKQNIAAH